MDARLVFQALIRTLPFYLQRRKPLADRERLPSRALRILHVHPREVGRKELCFVAPRAGAEFHHDRYRLAFLNPRGSEDRLHLCEELFLLFCERCPLFRGELRERGVFTRKLIHALKLLRQAVVLGREVGGLAILSEVGDIHGEKASRV